MTIEDAIRDVKECIQPSVGGKSLEMAIEALEKQAFFENEIGAIRDWFVDNKDCLLDLAQKVARDGFIESCVDEFIDEVDLDFIVVDIVDEIQKGVLNVLDTFIDNVKSQTIDK